MIFNPKVRKAVMAAAALIVILLIVYEGYSWYAHQVKTEKTTAIHIDASYHANGILFRDETVVPGVSEGALNFTVSDGEKVANGTIVASVYDNEDAASLQAQIKNLDENIKQLEAGLDSNYAFTNDVSQLEEEVQKVLYDLVESSETADDKNMGSSYALVNQLRSKKLYVLGKGDGLQSELDLLKAQRSELESRVEGSYQNISSPVAGYFIKQLDGYEGAYNALALDSLTPSSLEESIEKVSKGEDVSIPADAAGKVMTSFSWYYAFNMSEEEAKNLKKGQSANISFSFDTSNAAACTIYKITDAQDGQCTVILKSDIIYDGMLYLRSGEAQIVWKNYSGINISSSAVRVVDGESGVYCRVGNRAVFRKIDIIYEQDDFVVSSQHTDDKDYVQLYDDVITQGNDLYDGKLL